VLVAAALSGGPCSACQLCRAIEFFFVCEFVLGGMNGVLD
jgi:hypothetical protein